jgi:membrane protein implicated in regulation of membrane protease activity
LTWQEEIPMGMLLMIIAAMMAIPVAVLSSFSRMDPFWMAVVAIVAISVFGGILREFVKSRKEFNTTAQRELSEIKQRIAQIETDIGDIKEQIADFIIKNV